MVAGIEKARNGLETFWDTRSLTIDKTAGVISVVWTTKVLEAYMLLYRSGKKWCIYSGVLKVHAPPALALSPMWRRYI